MGIICLIPCGFEEQDSTLYHTALKLNPHDNPIYVCGNSDFLSKLDANNCYIERCLSSLSDAPKNRGNIIYIKAGIHHPIFVESDGITPVDVSA